MASSANSASSSARSSTASASAPIAGDQPVGLSGCRHATTDQVTAAGVVSLGCAKARRGVRVNESGLVTILFTDVVGSTEINSAIGDRAADELRRLHFDDLTDAIQATNGTLVKTIGDAVMASYAGAADALHGAVEMQRAVDRRNRRAAGQDLHIRIGVSAGDATFENDDWFGTPVVEASRLCSAAGTDQILISDIVGMLAGTRADHPIVSQGIRELKGLPAPISVSEVEWRSNDVDAAAVPLPGFVDTNPSFAFAGRSEPLEAFASRVEGGDRGALPGGVDLRRAGGRQDPAGHRVRSHGPSRRRCRAVGALRRGTRRALPAVRRSAPPVRRIDHRRAAARRSRPVCRRAVAARPRADKTDAGSRDPAGRRPGCRTPSSVRSRR